MPHGRARTGQRLAASRGKGASAREVHATWSSAALLSTYGIATRVCQSFPQVLVSGAPVGLVGLGLADGTVRVQRQRDSAVGDARRRVVVSV